MREECRKLITIARSPDANDADILKAQQGILDERDQLPFAYLLYIASDFLNSPVRVVDFKEVNRKEVIRRLDAVKKDLASRKMIYHEDVWNLMIESADIKEDQGVRIDTTDNSNTEKFTINVCCLNKEWLSKKRSDGLTNSDLVHMVIAHEAVGLLFNIDTKDPNAKVAHNKDKEIKTHQFGAYQYLHHVLNHRRQHNVQRFYADSGNKITITEALCYSLKDTLAKGDKERFIAAIQKDMASLADDARYGALRCCPLKHGGLVCPPDSAKPTTKIVTNCSEQDKCQAFKNT
ncbi:MAG: hypothetical protein PHI84_01390 [Kiritimatiellae bacterium]|nr:hypothetical protein [Kiritimatiellia bacterium]